MLSTLTSPFGFHKLRKKGLSTLTANGTSLMGCDGSYAKLRGVRNEHLLLNREAWNAVDKVDKSEWYTHLATVGHLTKTMCPLLELQHTATHCNTLQRTATHCSAYFHLCCFLSRLFSTRGLFWHCNTLQHTATHCNTLQHTATHSTHCERVYSSLAPYTKRGLFL